jgi:hypothetical protein
MVRPKSCTYARALQLLVEGSDLTWSVTRATLAVMVLFGSYNAGIRNQITEPECIPVFPQS